MRIYKYIIIGGGMAADSAVKGIREIDREGSILLISSERIPPYDRPPLSKSLWKNSTVDSIWRHTAKKHADIFLNTTARSIDPVNKVVSDNYGHSYGYGKLLLAIGGKVRKLPFGGNFVNYYRTLDDFRSIKDISVEIDTFGVIGSGFIGSEIAAALAMNGKKVVLFDIGPGIGWKTFPPSLVKFLNAYYKEKGVRIIPDAAVNNIEKVNNGLAIELKDGAVHRVDEVVAGIGILPNVKLAESIGLNVDNGILVNTHLQTEGEDIYAAGDVANFYNPLLDKRIRVEHADNANAMGKAAGRNMAGANEAYEYLPMFYSDLFDLGYEAVGILDSRFEIIEDWQEKFKKGTLFYLEDKRVRGVLLWNVWDKVEAARGIIGLPAPVDPIELIGKLR